MRILSLTITFALLLSLSSPHAPASDNRKHYRLCEAWVGSQRDLTAIRKFVSYEPSGHKEKLNALDFIAREASEVLQTLTDSELLDEVQMMINRYNEARGYLPGLSPSEPIYSQKEIVDDYLRRMKLNRLGASHIRNVAGNLSVEQIYRLLLESGSKLEEPKFEDVATGMIDSRLLLELERRIKAGSISEQ